MLTKTLRQLERDGLVVVRVHSEVPRTAQDAATQPFGNAMVNVVPVSVDELT